MLNIKQISILDNQQLVGTARYGISATPHDVAARFNVQPERSFDDLGYYEFLALESEVGVFGFRMHVGQTKRGSLVSFIPKREDVDTIGAISEIAGVPREDVSRFDENW